MDYLAASEKSVVRADDVLEVWASSRSAVNTILSRLAKKGWLQRLKRGSYSVIPLGAGTDSPAIANAWPVAAALFSPCFIAGWSAAEHWGLTDQIFNTIAVVTSKPQRTRDQRLGGIRFRVRTLPQEKLYGTSKIWFGSQLVPVADPHRTIIDILDDMEFGGGGRHAMDVVRAYWTSTLVDADTLLKYAQRLGRGSVFKRIGFTAEQFGKPEPRWIQECEANLTQGLSLLDPASPASGPVVSRWRLRINLPLDDQ